MMDFEIKPVINDKNHSVTIVEIDDKASPEIRKAAKQVTDNILMKHKYLFENPGDLELKLKKVIELEGGAENIVHRINRKASSKA